MADKARCEICDRNFKDAESLAMHNSAKHSSEKVVEKKSINLKKIRNWAIFIIVVGFFVFWIGNSIVNAPDIGSIGSEHSHANFMVFMNGEKINFALPKYMVRVSEVHIENMDGITMHKHATGVTLGHFFKTLGFKFDGECFVTDKKEKFCGSVKFYVDGVENFEYGEYEIGNGERYLISYGSSEEDIQEQINILDKTQIAD